MRPALTKSGLAGNGLVGTDLEEDKNRLEIAVKNEQYKSEAEVVVKDAGDSLGSG